VSEQEQSFGRDELGDSEHFGSPDPARLTPVTPAEPESAARPHEPPAEDDSNDVVDDLLLHAAQTVETLLNEVRASQQEIARLGSAQESRDGAPDQTRSPEEMVGEVLITARRVAEEMIAKATAEADEIATAARRDATPTLAEAEAVLERASTLYREAHTFVRHAQTEAASIVDAAREERERLISGAMSEATRRRTELELSNARLETAIKDLRTEWAGRAIDALVRLEGLGLDAVSSPGEASEPAELAAATEPERPELPSNGIQFES
jgi:cell division septum initiation protein DivIVA